MKMTYVQCPVCHNYSLNKATQRCEFKKCPKPSLGRFCQMVRRYKNSIIYLFIFLILVYLSPFRDTIHPIKFIKSLGIIGGISDLIKGGKGKNEPLDPPAIICPVTESSAYIKGKGAKESAHIIIYFNDKPTLTIQADDDGNFECNILGLLKVGDAISAQQTKEKEIGSVSSPIIVSDDALNLIKLKMEEEKQKISLIESSCTLLISWSVLIIGAVSYIILYKRRTIQLLWIAPFVIFLMVLSIYYGISVKSPMISAIDKSIPVLSMTNVHIYWWNQFEFFEQGLFLACILLVWNLGLPAPQGKDDA